MPDCRTVGSSLKMSVPTQGKKMVQKLQMVFRRNFNCGNIYNVMISKWLFMVLKY